MRHTFLFGAGASAGANLPTSQGLTRSVLEAVAREENNLHSQVLNFVVGGLLFRTGVIGKDPLKTPVDIEAVVRAIQLLTSREDLELAPFVGSWHSRVQELTAVNQEVFRNTHDHILELLCKILWVEDSASTHYLRPLQHLLAQQPLITITTLNFDNVVERFAVDRGIPLSTGLTSSYRAKRGYDFQFGDFGINLVKLHGSLDWILHEDGEWPSQRQPNRIPHRFVLAHGGPYRRGMMAGARPAVLLGGEPKLTAEGPYLELLRHFQETLHEADCLTVVGYSFRDEHVNSQIVSYLNTTQGDVRIVDPSPPTSQLFERIRLHKRVQVIEKPAQQALAQLFPATSEAHT